MSKRAFPIDRLMVDVATTLLCLFAALFAITVMLPHASKASAEVPPLIKSNIVVNAEWESDKDADVDLWVQAPGDEKPVGYSRRSDRQSSYLRDDRGTENDYSKNNYEIVSVQGLKAGRYVVNVHAYDLKTSGSVNVTVIATFNSEAGGWGTIATKQLTLNLNGQELTAFSFEIGDDGLVIPGSGSPEYIPLRTQEQEMAP